MNSIVVPTRVPKLHQRFVPQNEYLDASRASIRPSGQSPFLSRHTSEAEGDLSESKKESKVKKEQAQRLAQSGVGRKGLTIRICLGPRQP
jgi:hypothetical protein